MDPKLSLANPTGSLHFDAIHVANANEEAEAAKDAQIKDQELKQMFVSAFDDLIDGDESNDHNSDSDCSSSHSDVDQRSLSDNNVNVVKMSEGQQTSTPVSHNGAPALKTPSYQGNFEYQNHNNFGSTPQVNGNQHGDEYSKDQNNYLMAGGEHAGPHNVAQLEIINKAKDRQINNLKNQLQNVTDELQQEIRLLNHQNYLAGVEKNALVTSLEDAKKQTSEMEQNNIDLQADLKSLQMQMKVLNESKHQVELANQVLEKTIDNLEGELKTLQACDNLTRLRDQHENVVKNMQERHRKELTPYIEQIDGLKAKLETKSDEIVLITNKLEEARHEVDRINVSKSETINKLTQNLEESQRRCNNLLESDVNQEVLRVKAELKKMIANKDITENLLSSCQAEIRKLQAQVTTYEKAADLSCSSSPESLGNNTMSELLSHSKESSLVSLLRRKLKHYIAKNEEREQEIEQLQRQMESHAQEVSRANERSDKLMLAQSGYNEEIARLKEEIKCSCMENDEIKSLYIKVCEEKASVADELASANKRLVNYDERWREKISDNGELKSSQARTEEPRMILEERTIKVEKELEGMAAQKRLLERELESLKTKWKSEIETLKYKYSQDMSSTLNKMEAERRFEHSRALDEVKKKAADDRANLLLEQKNLLDKYHTSERESKELKKKLAEFDNVVARIQESFHHKLQDVIKQKDEKISSLGHEISSLKSMSGSQPSSNSNHEHKNQALEAKIEELKTKVKKCQKYAITKERNAHGEVIRLKTEFAITVDNMRLKMDELIAEHRLQVDTLSRQHRCTINELQSQLSESGNASVVKSAYLQALTNIKNEVLKYIREFNEYSDHRLRSGLKELAVHFDLSNHIPESDFSSSAKQINDMNLLSDKLSVL